MLNQDYPHDRYEIVLVDGMSTDRPRELVQAMAGKRDVAVRIVDKHLHPPSTYRYSVKVSNGMSRIVEWSGTEEGEREVGAVFEGQGGGSELTITSLKRGQWYIVISEVAIVPLTGGTPR